MPSMGKMLIILGVILIVIALPSRTARRYPGSAGWPGDISIKKDNFSFYFPITTSIIISNILTDTLFDIPKVVEPDMNDMTRRKAVWYS